MGQALRLLVATVAAVLLLGALPAMSSSALIAPEGSGASQGKIWIGNYTSQTFATIDAAVAGASAGDVIHISGQFKENGASGKGATVNKNVTLDVASDTTITGDGNSNGIALSNGATLKASGGATLKMKNFATAVSVGANSSIGDGNYVLNENKAGFALTGNGKVEGSARNALKISARNSSGAGFYYNVQSRFIRCTVDVQVNTESSEQYAPLNMQDASFTTKGVWFYFNNAGNNNVLSLDNSDFYVYKATGKSAYTTTMTLEGPSEIKNGSSLTSDGGRISFAGKALMDVNGSALTFKNSTGGGINIGGANAGVTFTDSTLTGENMRNNPLFGARGNYAGQFILFTGNSVVNTPASNKISDNGGASGVAKYVVTGGSFKLAYDENYNYNTTTPTNGSSNGDEHLTLMTLSDSGVNSLSPVNKNGNTYNYPVSKASSDGKKHVWVPAAKVTLSLNNGSATFADGTKKNKTFKTIRGYKLGDVEGNPQIQDPTDSKGISFLGWFYKDGDGNEKQFNPNTKLEKDLAVYAKWDRKSIVYHNGKGETFTDSISPDKNQARVMALSEVVNENNNFAVEGKKFKYWTTDPTGQNTPIGAGDNVTFAQGEKNIDLYAQYEDLSYTVTFSANGGQFSSSSVFRQNPNVFEVKADADGGEIAVVKKQATHKQKLREILGTLNHNLLKLDKDATRAGYLVADNDSWYVKADGSGTSYRFDDHMLFFFPIEGDNPEITSDVTFYIKWKNNPAATTVEAQGLEMKGDIWGKSREDSSKTEVAYEGKTFSLTGAVDISSMKEKMQAVETQFPGAAGNFSSIALSEQKSTFTAVLTLPEGIKIPTNPTVTAAGLGECFDLAKTSVEANKVTVTFTLKKGLNNYEKLKNAVDSAGIATTLSSGNNTVTLTIDGLELDSANAVNEQKLTALGEVTGDFHAIAKRNSNVRRFKFSWAAKQDDGGRDENATNPDTLQKTFLVSRPIDLILEGDILIGEDTGHDELHEVTPGDSLTYTGRLDVSAIKAQIQLLKDNYGGDFTKIKTDKVSSVFTAVLKVPEGLTLPDNPTAELKSNNLFAIDRVKKNGRNITVTMKLTKNYTKFSDIYNDTMATPSTLNLNIGAITVPTNTANGTQLTVSGDVTGNFVGEAVSESGKIQAYNFKWKAEQTDAGRDFPVKGTPDKTIRYTVNSISKSKITVKHVDLDGSEIAPADSKSGYFPGNGFKPASPDYPAKAKTVSGYTLVTEAHAITGLFGNQLTTDTNIPFEINDKIVYFVYTNSKSKATVKYLDDTAGGVVLHTEQLEGIYGTTDTYGTAAKINDYKNAGYEVVSDNYPPNGVTYKLQPQEFTVHLKHKIMDRTDTKESKLTVRYHGAGSKTPNDHVQKVEWKRKIKVDVVTGVETEVDPWTPAKIKYDEVVSPSVSGYTPDVPKVNAENVTQNDIYLDVNYLGDGQHLTYTVIDDTENKTLENALLASGSSDGVLPAGTSAAYDNVVSRYEALGYKMISKDTLPAKFDDDNAVDQNVKIRLVHDTQDNVENAAYTFTVRYGGAGNLNPPDSTQTVNWSRTIRTDKVTGVKNEVAGWTADKLMFNEVHSPAVEGYTPDINTVAQMPVSRNNVIKDVNYTADAQILTYTAIDETENTTLAGEKTLAVGTSFLPLSNDTHAAYDKLIKEYENKGYEVVSKDTLPATFDSNKAINQNVTVRLKHGREDVTEINHVSLRIRYTGAGEKTPSDHLQNAQFRRTVTKDKVTGEPLNYTPWVANKTKYDKVDSPVIAGYTVDIASIDPEDVIHSDVIKEVRYKALSASGRNASNVPGSGDKQNVDTASPKMPDKGDNNKKVGKTSKQVGRGKKVIEKATSKRPSSRKSKALHKHASQQSNDSSGITRTAGLPDTADRSNIVLYAALLFAGTLILGLLIIIGRKKERKE